MSGPHADRARGHLELKIDEIAREIVGSRWWTIDREQLEIRAPRICPSHLQRALRVVAVSARIALSGDDGGPARAFILHSAHPRFPAVRAKTYILPT